MEFTDIVQDVLPIQPFLTDWHVRATWIAFMTLWVFWGLTWFVRNAFGGDSSTHAHNVQSNTHQISHDPALNSTADPETAATANTTTDHKKGFLPAPAWSVKVFNRLNRAHDMLRDLVIMLLSVLTLNSFARASTRAVMIIAWLFVAFAFVYFVLEVSVEHRYLRLLYSLTFYALGLAIVGLAYAQGFY
ncbi:uncharacterized protein B0P05DRAFT_464825 [Gilbertella persicaria]|uniref:uncharacterized protein n=1 Tax=Gilbertella persicaria TaxID=101096 RepID=UPI00221E9F08|nr:uncharacterized protein B0P05DRAFT_464825 [Gilbertella persicaria]KAI8087956.1 hypothetical protein B0P05DRAFT_464825 [Gilbertella persicaria]